MSSSANLWSSSSFRLIELQGNKWKTMTPSNFPASLSLVCLLALASLAASAAASQPNKQQTNIPIPLNSVKQPAAGGNGNNRQQQSNNNQAFAARNASARREPAPVGSETPGDWFMMDQEEELLAPQEAKALAAFQEPSAGKLHPVGSIRRSGSAQKQKKKQPASSNRTFFDDDSIDSDAAASTNEVADEAGEEAAAQAGSAKEPECAAHGRYYCTFKEDYPLKLVTEVTKYYKWPLEKLFRDLHAQIMPKLAQDSTGNLVCDSITRVVRPGWARNTNERWLVVINTENYHQYVTEVVCQYGSNSRCNFIPPCYYSSCQQRYNTQKLLVIDPSNPYRGPFLSEFLFPSCCVCYVPSASDSFQDKYRSSPATIYQRTMQQESANNIYPPQFKPAGLLEDPQQQGSLAAGSEHSLPARLAANPAAGSPPAPPGIGSKEAASGGQQAAGSGQVAGANQAAGPGEIRRRAGEAFRQQQQEMMELNNFPRLGLSDSLESNSQASGSGQANAGSQQ